MNEWQSQEIICMLSEIKRRKNLLNLKDPIEKEIYDLDKEVEVRLTMLFNLHAKNSFEDQNIGKLKLVRSQDLDQF